jgi:hypothetical protein
MGRLRNLGKAGKKAAAAEDLASPSPIAEEPDVPEESLTVSTSQLMLLMTQG